jgi:hypothetical protein
MLKFSVRRQDELSKILDACLEQIASGSKTVDSVIEQYPKYKDQLKPALEAAQWLQNRKEVFNPRPGFVQLSQRRLINRFRNNGGSAAATSTETLSRIPAFFQERRLVVQYSALLTLTAVLLFVGYRSTSFLIQRSIPGDPLYETKLAQEELRVSISSNEEAQTRLRIQFAQRRVIEMQELVIAGRDSHLDETLANFEYQMTEAAAGILIVAETDQGSAAVLSTIFEETLTVPVKNLVGILDTTSAVASAVFIDSFNTLTAGVFDQPLYDPVLAFADATPTSTYTATSTPTPTFTATFTPTFTATNLPTATPTSTEEPTATSLPTNTPVPTNPPAPSNTAEPKTNPTPKPPLQPTSAPPPTSPPPTDPPPATEAPEPTNNPEPTPEKTKKPKPTEHPTHRPPATQGN